MNMVDGGGLDPWSWTPRSFARGHANEIERDLVCNRLWRSGLAVVSENLILDRPARRGLAVVHDANHDADRRQTCISQPLQGLLHVLVDEGLQNRIELC